MAGATISIYLDDRIKKESGVYPLKIRATYNRQRIYIGLSKEKINSVLNNSVLEKYRYEGQGNYSIRKDLFEKAMSVKKSGELKDLQIVFKGVELAAQKKADEMKPFTFEGLKEILSDKKTKENRVFALFGEVIAKLEAEDRVGTAKSYGNASTSLKEFVGARDVTFEYFTKDRLQKYRKWMVEENQNSETTVGIYLRALRTVFNEAINRGITKHYPFTRGNRDDDTKFRIPKGGGRKIALTREELKKIFSFELPESHPYCYYLDMWKLMFYLGGINPTDLCNLRKSNIKGDFIYYSRQKTARTSNEKKVIQVPYTAEVAALFNRWESNRKGKDPLLLSVIEDKLASKTKKAKIDQFIKMINTAMKAVGIATGIEKHITTYVARHSIATQLLQAGAPVKFIGDQLGHHSTSTTEAYLNGFTEDQIKENFRQVTKF